MTGNALLTTEKTQTAAYTAPTKTGNNSYYDTPGKMVTTSVRCNISGNTVIGTTPDKCEEIAKPSGVCTDATKVYYKCTQQNDNSTQYNLCASGNSILANVVGKTEVSNNYTAPVITSASNYTIGYLTMSVGGTSVPVSDTCVAIAKSGTTSSSGQKCKCGGTASSGVCASLNSSRMYCVGINNTGDCDNDIVEIGDVLDTAVAAQTTATSAANAVSGKLDASALTVGSDGTLSYGASCSTNIVGVTTEQKSAVNDVTYWYRKYRVNTTCPTTNITPNGTGAKLYNWLDNFCSQGGTGYSYDGTLGIGDGSAKVGDACYNSVINSGKFDLFVKIDNSDSMLSSLNNKVESSDLTTAVNSAVAGAVEDQEFSFGKDASNSVVMKLSEIVEILGQVVGNCTSVNNGTEVSCSGGSLSNLSINIERN